MNVCIFDDEIMAIDFLSYQLNQLSNINILYSSTFPIIDDLSSVLNQTQIVFLDIEMPGTNGLVLAETITSKFPHISIIFVSAYNQYAVDAFDLYALDYLLKPVQLDRLDKAIQRLNIQHQHLDTVKKSRQLMIQSFGPLSFKYEDDPEDLTIHWRTLKSKELFLYLLHFHQRVLLKSELIEVLWPEIDPEKAMSHLYVSIYNIRQSFLRVPNHIEILNCNDGYTIRLNNVVHIKENWCHAKFPLTAETLERHLALMNDFVGPYLDGLDYMWAEGTRYETLELWIYRAKTLALYYNKMGDVERAAHWYQKICQYRPEDEQIVFELIKIYDQLNYRMLIEHQFSLHKQALAEIDVALTSELANWYDQWKLRHATYN